MSVPVQITFRNLPVSDNVEALCWSEAEKLGQQCQDVSSCRVLIADPQNAERDPVEVTIHITVRQREIAFRQFQPRPGVDDAVRRAFANAQLRLGGAI